MLPRKFLPIHISSLVSFSLPKKSTKSYQLVVYPLIEMILDFLPKGQRLPARRVLLFQKWGVWDDSDYLCRIGDLDSLILLRRYSRIFDFSFNSAIAGGHLRILRWARHLREIIINWKATASFACIHQKLEILKWVFNVSGILPNTKDVFDSGNIDILDWYWNTYGPFTISEEKFYDLAEKDDLDLMIWLYDHKFKIDSFTSEEREHSRPEGQAFRRHVVPEIERITGNPKILDWFHRILGHVPNEAQLRDLVENSYMKGKLEKLKYLKDSYHVLPNTENLNIAASCGHLSILKWGWSLGLHPDMVGFRSAIICGHSGIAQYIHEITGLIPEQHIVNECYEPELLEWMYQKFNMLPIFTPLCYNPLEKLIWLYEKEIPIDISEIKKYYGYLNISAVIKFLEYFGKDSLHVVSLYQFQDFRDIVRYYRVSGKLPKGPIHISTLDIYQTIFILSNSLPDGLPPRKCFGEWLFLETGMNFYLSSYESIVKWASRIEDGVPCRDDLEKAWEIIRDYRHVKRTVQEILSG